MRRNGETVAVVRSANASGIFSTRFTELVGVPPSVYRRRAARDGGDAVVRGETGDRTDQDSRSAGHRAAASVTAMNVPRNRAKRWITVGPADQPGTSIVLHPPAAEPGITDDERRTIAEFTPGRVGSATRPRTATQLGTARGWYAPRTARRSTVRSSTQR
jgi:hypothetical protein